MGDWTTCDPNPCNDLTGACCADAAVCEIQTQANCGDVFLGVGTTCDPNPCEAIVGACCHDNGTCQITLEVDCGDFYQGNRTVCDPNPCAAADAADPSGDGSHALLLEAPYPVPTRGEVEIAWSLPRAGLARLTVWDVGGRLLATLFQGDVNAGPGRREFRLADGSGRILPSGVYWLRLATGGRSEALRIVHVN